MVGLLETRVRERNKEKVFKGLKLLDWELITTYEHAELGRIWLLFKEGAVDVRILETNSQFIH